MGVVEGWWLEFYRGCMEGIGEERVSEGVGDESLAQRGEDGSFVIFLEFLTLYAILQF